MVVTEGIIDDYLSRVARGQREYLRPALLHMSNETVFTPIILVEDLSDDRETQKIKVATFSSHDRRWLPVFTDEESFREWATEEHDCFPVAGGDLALTLPPDTWVVLNPGKANTVELSPEDLRQMADAGAAIPEEAPIEEDAPIEDAPIEDAPIEEMSEDPFAPLEDLPTELDLSPYSETASEIQTQERDSSDVEIVVTKELSAIFADYDLVSEGYYFETVDEENRPQGVLGLLTGEIDAELRFLLIDRIAELSRKQFRAAGAIEVYDDLSSKTSSSWELFSTISPFYVREDYLSGDTNDPDARSGFHPEMELIDSANDESAWAKGRKKLKSGLLKAFRIQDGS